MDGVHTLVFTFNSAVSSGHASVTSGNGALDSEPTFSGNQMSMTLVNVPNDQLVTVTATNVAGGGSPALPSVSVTFGVVEGASAGNQYVSSSDIVQVKSRTGQSVNATNFRSDFNCSGTINSADILLAKARSGTGLP